MDGLRSRMSRKRFDASLSSLRVHIHVSEATYNSTKSATFKNFCSAAELRQARSTYLSFSPVFGGAACSRPYLSTSDRVKLL